MQSGNVIRLAGREWPLESPSATLETALALSVATGRGFVSTPPRAPTSAVRFFGALCDADISEGPELRFEPGRLAHGAIRLSVDGGPSLLRMVRAAALPLALSGKPSQLTATGVTHAPDGETFEVSSSTWVHWMRKAGLDVALRLERAGFAPRGGGELVLTLGAEAPVLAPFELSSKGSLDALHIVSAASSLPAHVQQRQAARARSGVSIAGVDSTVQLLKLPAHGSGSTVAITGIFGGTPITVSAVSERGRSVEWVGELAAFEFRRLATGTGVVPPALLCSLVLAAAFARGDSRVSTYRLPAAMKSFAELVTAFTGRIVEVDGKPGQPGEVRVAK